MSVANNVGVLRSQIEQLKSCRIRPDECICNPNYAVQNPACNAH